MPTRKPVQQGDVFETRLSDGRFGAIRVIKTNGKSFLLAVTPYIAAEPPEISHPSLGEILIKKSFSWGGTPALTGYSKPKLYSRRYVGNLPLSPSEQALELWFGVGGFPFGSWGHWVGQEALREWRWEHERAALEEEARQEKDVQARARDVQPTPGKMMVDEEFWKFIALVDWSKTGDDNAVLKPAVEALAQLRISELQQFEETLSYKLFLLDTRDHAKNTLAESDAALETLSADGFLYERCVVVANGQELYDAVLSDPSKMPKDLEFEALLSLTPKALERKTRGKREFDFVPSCSYETYSNRDGWR